MTEGSPYAGALQVALEVAREAGALLLADFHRAGGPRGHGDKAEADVEAEELIRNRLAQAFPEHGTRGEELRRRDQPARDAGPHVWLIDPNDGTASYLRGQRGSAVSIALVRAGQPVLGVVYAYAAPDSAGDLLAWAEGCGPATRNGVPLSRRAWAGALAAEHTLLVARGADRKPGVNAGLADPARFRGVASVAYRLALVAAGEGEAGVSLHQPGDWDFAGAHALLRAVGGQLVDAVGQPVAYRADGVSPPTDCFGGSPAIVPGLAGRDWSRALGGKPAAAEEYDLSWPEAGRAIADPGRLARAQGCLLGQLAGDALGSLVEFRHPREIRTRYPDGVRAMHDGGTWSTIAGQPTDDSELALMLARVLAAGRAFDEEAVARAYAWWRASGPFDCGATTRQALSAAVAAAARPGTPVAAAARAAGNRGSQANGALMRVSPLGIFAHDAPPERVLAWARADASLTHPDPVCGDASAVFAAAIAHAVASGEGPRAVYDRARDWAARVGVHADVQRWLAAAEVAPPAEFLRQAGWVAIAFQNAFHRLLRSATLEQGVVATIAEGGDTDTNAAIAGALLGAVHGRDAVPFGWRDRVLTCRPLAGRPGVVHPRPRAFWPVDALVLAEHLLLAGEGR